MKELNYKFEKIGNIKKNYYRDKIERLKLFGDNNKEYRKNSFNSRINKKNDDKFIYRYKTKKNLI